MRAIIRGTGMYVPDNVVDNHRLSRLMDTSDEWIRQRTGIVTRRFAGKDQANPFGMMASVAMAFRHSLGAVELARTIELAMWDCVSEGECTPDLGGTLTTAQAGEAARRRLGEFDTQKVAYI